MNCPHDDQRHAASIAGVGLVNGTLLLSPRYELESKYYLNVYLIVMIRNIKHNVPYVYLKSATTQGSCDLYLAVSIPNGFELVAPSSRPGIIVDAQRNANIEIQLKRRPQVQGVIHKRHYSLTLPGDTVFPDAWVAVTVNILDEQDSTIGSYSNRMLFRDRDPDTDPTVASNQTAYNCPYLYLEGPANSQNGTTTHAAAQTRYQPHVLLFPRGYRLLSNEVQITSPENGIFETYLFLTNDENVGTNAAPITDLTVNQSHYYDTGGREGNFLVTVILEDHIDLQNSISQTKETARHQALMLLEDQTLADSNGNATPSGATQPRDEGEPPIEEEGEEGGVAMRSVAARTNSTSSVPRRRRKKAKTRNLSARRGLAPAEE